MRFIAFIFILLFPCIVFGQYAYFGKVLDSITAEPLPFVNIRVGNTQQGFTTDIDGAFHYKSTDKIAFFEFNYLGYDKKKVALKAGEKNVVYLSSNTIGLAELVVDAGYNPALAIVKRVISNRNENNPEKNLNYTYESYNKLVFSAEYDSLKASKQDSTLIKMQQFFAKQDLMLLETVVETFHKAPNQTKDIVTASRTSGLKNAMLPMLATELQSFSFYNTFFTLSGVQYISPITQEGFNKYQYELLDEYVEGNDTISVVSFSPKKGRSFEAMEGVLYISSYKHGVKNVIAKPVSVEGMAEVQINQKYQIIDGLWFPEQLNSNLVMKNMSLDGLNMIGKSTSYLKNIDLNPSKEKLKFDNITLEIDVQNNSKNDSALSKSRYSPLTSRDSLTYHIIDSIGKEAKLDKKLMAMESLLEGRVPIGPLDLDINKSLGYNNYEGFRLGAGLYTNQKVLKWLSLGGYFGYGFKDEAWKYGGELDLKLVPKKGVGLKTSYSYDISQVGSLIVGENKKLGNNQDLYEYFTNLFDEDENWAMELRFRVKGVKTKLIGKLQRLRPLYDYSYVENVGQNTEFQTTEFFYSLLGVEASYSPFSKVMYNGRKLVDISSKYPLFQFSYYHTIPYLTTHEIRRLVFKISDDFSLPFLGKSSYAFVGGKVSDGIPISYMFNQQGTKDDFSISVFESFETMFTNEFFASSFVNAFWEQNFGTFAKKGFFQPEFALYQGVGIGNKLKEGSSGFLEGKSMEKGYYESGIKIHNIIHSGTSGFGFGVFYRYGPYSKPLVQDNFTYKITLSLGF